MGYPESVLSFTHTLTKFIPILQMEKAGQIRYPCYYHRVSPVTRLGKDYQIQKIGRITRG